MPKIKPVMAWDRWMWLWGNGDIGANHFECREDCADFYGAPNPGGKIVRVRISVVPKAKRKVKK